MATSRRTLTPCLVIIPLARTVLELTTSAAHAFEIVNGQTALPSLNAQVFDADGKRVNRGELIRIREADEGNLATDLRLPD